MEEKVKKSNFINVVYAFIFMVIIIVIVTNGTNFLKQPTDVFIVSNGSLSYEETVEGYVIRDETVLQGENYKNGMVQILSDGERAAKAEAFFRYYSSSEESILAQIAELDEQINELIETSDLNIVSSDISSIEDQIEDLIDSMHDVNYLQTNQEYKNKIETLFSKKAQITGIASPEDSYLRTLTDQRNALEAEIEADAEVIYAPKSGLASYRVDGLEEILTVNEDENFDYISTELLESFDLKVGATIPLSSEKGKVVDNFYSYIAVPIDTEKSMTALVGDTVTLRLSNSDEIDAEIVYIKEEENSRVIIFKITEDVEELIQYRKITLDIIWWQYSGLKVSNSALIEDGDKVYVEKSSAGYTEKVLVKVLRQNDTYSIVENYESEELEELGYTTEEISDMDTLDLYDEVVLH